MKKDLKVKLRGNQLAIYKIDGVKRDWFVMVNAHNQILINVGFATPMSYMGASVEDVENFYLSHRKGEAVFGGEWKSSTWLPVEFSIFEA